MFRSQSGPGALSINTTAANSASASSSVPPPSAGKSLFGATATSTQPQTSTMFNTSTTTSQPPAASSLFGNTQPQSQNSQPQQGGGLFGNQNPQQAQSGGLFGGGANMTQTTGGLFGSQQPQSSSNNLFANSTQSQAQTGGGLFGSTLGQPSFQQSNSNPFGSFGNQNRSSLLGTNQISGSNQQPAMPPPSQPSLFSATIGQHTQQQQTVPGVRISVNELRPTTRFNDLHEDLQKGIEYVDNFIANKMQWKDACADSSKKINDNCLQLPPDVQYCTKQLATLQQALENDAESIAFAKSLVNADAADTKLSIKAIQNLRLPPQIHQTSLWSTAMTSQNATDGFGDEEIEPGASRDLVEYFSKQTESMSKSLDNYKRNIAGVEEYLEGIESNTMQQLHQMRFAGGSNGGGKSAEDEVRELAAVLRAFENGILGVATKVGSVRESVQDTMLSIGSSNTHVAKDNRLGAI